MPMFESLLVLVSVPRSLVKLSPDLVALVSTATAKTLLTTDRATLWTLMPVLFRIWAMLVMTLGWPPLRMATMTWEDETLVTGNFPVRPWCVWGVLSWHSAYYRIRSV